MPSHKTPQQPKARTSNRLRPQRHNQPNSSTNKALQQLRDRGGRSKGWRWIGKVWGKKEGKSKRTHRQRNRRHSQQPTIQHNQSYTLTLVPAQPHRSHATHSTAKRHTEQDGGCPALCSTQWWSASLHAKTCMDKCESEVLIGSELWVSCAVEEVRCRARAAQAKTGKTNGRSRRGEGRRRRSEAKRCDL